MHSSSPLDFLYIPTPSEMAPFGDAWCGPNFFRHGKLELVARYKSEEGSDGQTAEVFCLAMPARFYTIRALEGVNSIGEHQPAFEFQTGSGCEQIAADVAQAIAGGMLTPGRVKNFDASSASASGKEQAGSGEDV